MDRVLKIVYSRWFESHGTKYPFANGTTEEFYHWAIDQIKTRNLKPSGEFDFVNEINSRYFFQDPSSNYYFRNSNFYLHCKKNNISFVSEGEVVEDDSAIYYYPVEVECNTFYYVTRKYQNYNIIDTFSEKIRNHLKSGRVKLLISNMVDPCTYLEDLQELETFLINNDIKQATFLTGNKLNKTFQNIQIVDSIISLYQTAAGMDNFPHPSTLGYISDYVKEQDLTEAQRSKKFLCFNRFMNKKHRVGMAYLCLKYNLLDDGYFSFLYNPIDDYDYRLQQLNLPVEYAENIKNLVPYEVDTDLLPRNQLSSFFSVTNYKKDLYLDSYIHIVTETQFEEDFSPFFSEKTWRPILNLQPFIYLGNPFSLNSLKNLGFKTFDPFIDESYDLEIDPIKRFAKIEREIEKLSLLKNADIHEWYHSIKDVLIHNQKLLYQYKNYNPICNLINLK